MFKILEPEIVSKYQIPFFISPVPAGFPSPAEDYSDTKLDLNKHLIQNPNSTFFVAITGDSIVNADISSGDIAIVDRALEARNGDIILAVVDGDFTIKRLELSTVTSSDSPHAPRQARLRLLPENSDYQPIEITEHVVFQVWGVVTYTIRGSR